MKASELRIGNWVEKGGKQYQVTAIGIFCCGVNHNPIPLTEEWLVRFGFEFEVESINGKWYILKEFEVHIDYYRECFLVFDMQKNLHIPYVHTLQNLYFALKGEELSYQSNPRSTATD